jgi:hypothetical protein
MYPAATYYPGSQQGPAPGIAYAGFWIRLVAVILDGIIVGVPLAIIFFVAEGSAITDYANCLNSAGITGTLATTCEGSSSCGPSSAGPWASACSGSMSSTRRPVGTSASAARSVDSSAT